MIWGNTLEPVPFACTAEAEERITAFLNQETDMVPAIIVCFGSSAVSNEGEPLHSVEGVYFNLGYYWPDEVEGVARFDFKGKQIVIHDATLEYLQGKTLVLSDVGVIRYKEGWKHGGPVLRAE